MCLVFQLTLGRVKAKFRNCQCGNSYTKQFSRAPSYDKVSRVYGETLNNSLNLKFLSLGLESSELVFTDNNEIFWRILQIFTKVI
jgi:hypothetical protein